MRTVEVDDGCCVNGCFPCVHCLTMGVWGVGRGVGGRAGSGGVEAGG